MLVGGCERGDPDRSVGGLLMGWLGDECGTALLVAGIEIGS